MSCLFDGSFGADGTASAGMVLRDSMGCVLFTAYHYIFNCNDALEAEIHALMQGMALAIQHSSLPVVVQSDSIQALSTLTSASIVQSAVGI